MKLQFDATLLYQKRAVAAVVDLFKGQPIRPSIFTVAAYTRQGSLFGTEHGVGNRLELEADRILKNVQEIQGRNGLAPAQTLDAGGYAFDVEMETGTGKTYVYLRTIFELNKAYGFTKFIIVVPSIAIKEGVYKSLQITREHFEALYNPVYDYFVYDSSKLEQVRSFALSDHIVIMIINIDAFRRSFGDPASENKANIIHRSNDKLNGRKPIELIRETAPIVLIDEPQSVDTTPKAKEAIASLNPLCTVRYSATHVEKHILLYKLDALDSFRMELVKQIEVAGFATQDDYNAAYMRLQSVNNRRSPITARLELDVNVRGTVKRKKVTVQTGNDLYEVSKGRTLYQGYIIDEIYCEPGREYLSFTSKPEILRPGAAFGGVDDLAIKEQQIRRTIQEHLDKELVLTAKGVKVLSLFFIDRVANYRTYDAAGKPQKGLYAQLFEKHYSELIRLPQYAVLAAGLDLEAAAQEAHNGYFAVDKRGMFKDTSGDTSSDDNVYNLIMRDKEKLLSFDTKLRFIFSHSALREGWDNPNVFQICTLNETQSTVKKRQEIGRGLRLCVNQNGERQQGLAINTLTIIANESYEDFASKLQKEYEQDEGIRFEALKQHAFVPIPVKPAEARRTIELREETFRSFDFQELWDRIKGKTRYTVDFESQALIAVCGARLRESLAVGPAKLIYTKARLTVSPDGVDATKTVHTAVATLHEKAALPDIITYLQNRTHLTRKTLAAILVESRTLPLFRKNPQLYMEDAARIIAAEMQRLAVDKVRYAKLGGQAYYPQELFMVEPLTGYLGYTVTVSQKSVHTYVSYGSSTEKSFAESLENNESVSLYIKLPSWFKIATPLGPYTPDWAFLIERDGQGKQAFVLETKRDVRAEALHPTESAKIACGAKHFEALGTGVIFDTADSFEHFWSKHERP